jgi:hypothetical protein
MNTIALQEPVSKLKGSFTDPALPGKPFIWLPDLQKWAPH